MSFGSEFPTAVFQRDPGIESISKILIFNNVQVSNRRINRTRPYLPRYTDRTDNLKQQVILNTQMAIVWLFLYESWAPPSRRGDLPVPGACPECYGIHDRNDIAVITSLSRMDLHHLADSGNPNKTIRYAKSGCWRDLCVIIGRYT